MINQTFGWTLAALLLSPFALIAVLFIAYTIDSTYRRFTGKWLIVKDSYPGDTVAISKISSPYKYHTFAEVLSQPKLNDNQRRELLQQQIKAKGLDKSLYNNDGPSNTPISTITTSEVAENVPIVDLPTSQALPMNNYQPTIRKKAIAYQTHSNQVKDTSTENTIVSDSLEGPMEVVDAVKRFKEYPKDIRVDIIRRLAKGESSYKISKEVLNITAGRNLQRNKSLFEAIRPLLKKGQL